MTGTRLNWRFGILPASIFLVSCSQPEPPKELCAQFNSVIDRNIVDIAISNSMGDDIDKSAMQQTARAQDNENRLSVIVVNIQLQAHNKCAPRTKPIDPSQYGKNAVACHTAKVLQNNVVVYRRDPKEIAEAEKRTAEACDFSKWSPQGGN